MAAPSDLPSFSDICRTARDMEKRLISPKVDLISGQMHPEGSDIFPHEFEEYTYAYLLTEAHKVERKLFAASYQSSLSARPGAQKGMAEREMEAELRKFSSSEAQMPQLQQEAPSPAPSSASRFPFSLSFGGKKTEKKTASVPPDSQAAAAPQPPPSKPSGIAPPPVPPSSGMTFSQQWKAAPPKPPPAGDEKPHDIGIAREEELEGEGKMMAHLHEEGEKPAPTREISEDEAFETPKKPGEEGAFEEPQGQTIPEEGEEKEIAAPESIVKAEPQQPVPKSTALSSSKISPRLRAIIEEKLRREDEKEAAETEAEKEAPQPEQEPVQPEAPHEEGGVMMSSRERLLKKLQKQKEAKEAEEGQPEKEEIAAKGEPEQSGAGEELQQPSLRPRPRTELTDEEEKEPEEPAPKFRSRTELTEEEGTGEKEQEPSQKAPPKIIPIKVEEEKEGPREPEVVSARQKKSLQTTSAQAAGLPTRASAMPSGSLMIKPIFSDEEKKDETAPSEGQGAGEDEQRAARIQRIIDGLSADKAKAKAVGLIKDEPKEEETAPEKKGGKKKKFAPQEEETELVAGPETGEEKEAEAEEGQPEKEEEPPDESEEPKEEIPVKAEEEEGAPIPVAAPLRKSTAPLSKVASALKKPLSKKQLVLAAKEAASLLSKKKAPAKKDVKAAQWQSKKETFGEEGKKKAQLKKEAPVVLPKKELRKKPQAAPPRKETPVLPAKRVLPQKIGPAPTRVLPAKVPPAPSKTVPRRVLPQKQPKPVPPKQARVPPQRVLPAQQPAPTTSKLQPRVLPISQPAPSKPEQARVLPQKISITAPLRPGERMRVLPGGKVVQNAPATQTYIPPARPKPQPPPEDLDEHGEARDSGQRPLEPEDEGEREEAPQPVIPHVDSEEERLEKEEKHAAVWQNQHEEQEEEPEEEPAPPKENEKLSGVKPKKLVLDEADEKTPVQLEEERRVAEKAEELSRMEQTRKTREISGEARLPPKNDDEEFDVPLPPSTEDEAPKAEEYEEKKEEFKVKMEGEDKKDKAKAGSEDLLEQYAKENLVWLYEIYKMGGMSRDDFLIKVRDKMNEEKSGAPAQAGDASQNPALQSLGKEIDKKMKKRMPWER